MHNRSKLTKGLSLIYAFLLTLFFVVFFLSIGFSLGLFNDKSVTRAMKESNYYNAIHEALNSYSEELIEEAGLPATVLEDVITTQRLYIAGKNYVTQVLRGEEPQIKTDKLVSKLTENIGLYVQQENIRKTEELKSGTTNLIAEIEAEYKEAVSLPFATYFNEYKGQYNKLLLLIIPIVIVIVGLLCYLLIRMHRYKHRGLRYIVYALMAASLIIILAASYLLITKQYAGIQTSPDYYKNFLQELLSWSIRIFLYIGGIGLTIAIGLISLVTYLKAAIKNI